MSVIIKGMKLPKGCDGCELVQDYDEDSVCCPFLRSESWYGAAPDYRLEHCPLIGIPTPHGRLIDADELIGYLNEWLSDSVALSGFTRIINHQPTIIEAEVSE